MTADEPDDALDDSALPDESSLAEAPAYEDVREIADRQAAVRTAVREHAGEIARSLAVLNGGDYGSETFETDAGSWTLKYDAGDVDYLRYEPRSGEDTYVVTDREPPSTDRLVDALADYDAFVDAFASHVDATDGLLDEVDTDFPAVASTAELAADRDRLCGRIRAVADEMAGQLARIDGEYGTFATTISGTRWELKWDEERASYLRVGGSDGTYVLSQYSPPTPRELARHVEDVPDFVAAFNDHVGDLESELAGVSLDES